MKETKENKKLIERANNIKEKDKRAFSKAESDIEKEAKRLFKAPKTSFYE